MRTAPHLCVFVGSWSRNSSSKYSLFLMGYDRVYCNFSFLGQDVFSMVMGSFICRKIVFESRPGHPRKFPFLWNSQKLSNLDRKTSVKIR